MVRMVGSSGPLFCNGIPVCGGSGGGKSRLRGIRAELEGGLVSGLAEVRQEVATLLLAGMEDLTGGGLVDGLGPVLTELLEAATQLFQKSVRREGGLGRHRLLRRGKRTTARAAIQLRLPLSVGAPERFATPVPAMSLPLVFRRAARAEFDDAADWYEQHRAGQGAAFVAAVQKVLDQI